MWAAAWVVAASAVALHHVAPLPSAYAAAGTTTTRRMALHKAAAAAALGFGFRPSATAEARVPLARAQIEAKLAKVPVVALVNADDAPYLDGAGVGYFYLDPTEALLSLKLLQKNSPDARLKVVTLTEVYFPLVRGEQPNLGGVLRVRPSRREVVLANRALAFQQRENALLPTSLDEAKGQVPVFYSERVAYESKGGEQTFPFFLSKEDLDAAYDELQRTIGDATAAAAAAIQRDGKSGGGSSGGIPIGLVRVATLDGLVDQMRSGEVDLSQAVLIPPRTALRTVRSIVLDGAA